MTAADRSAIRARTRRSEAEFADLFTVIEPISAHLRRRIDAALPDKYDQNAFEASGVPAAEELAAALAYQRRRGDSFWKLESDEPLPEALLAPYGFEVSRTATMALLEATPAAWHIHAQAVIRRHSEEDVSEALLAVELETSGPLYGEDFARRNLSRYLSAVGSETGFDYLAAYLDGVPAGCCHVFDNGDVRMIDGLVVREGLRRRGVAAALLAAAAGSGRLVCLHADFDDAPFARYRRMGFCVVDELWEYLKTGL